MKINRNKGENANQSQKYHRYFYVAGAGVENTDARDSFVLVFATKLL